MTNGWIGLVLVLVVAACTAGRAVEEPGGVHGAAIDFAANQGQTLDGDAVLVAGPLPEMWDQWCAGGSELRPCLALQAMTIDLATPFDDAERADIEAALAPASVDYVGNAPGMLTFGRAIEVEGTIYVPLDGQGSGWLLQATAIGDRWQIEPLAEWDA